LVVRAALVVSAVQAVPVGLAVQVMLVVSEEPVVSAGLVASEELAVQAASVVQTVRRNCLPEAVAGSTTPNIAAALPMEIARRQTGLAVRLAATPFPIAKQMPGSRLGGRAAILPAVTAEEPGSAIVQASVAAIAVEELA